MGFLLGLIVGILVGPIILAIIIKPVSKWFLKRKLNGFLKAVSLDARTKMDKFNEAFPGDYDNGKEDKEEIR